MKPGAKPIFRTSLSFIKHQATQTAILTDTLSLLRPRHPALAAALLHPASASPPPALGVEAVPQSPRILHMHMSCTCACACTRLPLARASAVARLSRGTRRLAGAPRRAGARRVCLLDRVCLYMRLALRMPRALVCLCVQARQRLTGRPKRDARTHMHTVELPIFCGPVPRARHPARTVISAQAPRLQP